MAMSVIARGYTLVCSLIHIDLQYDFCKVERVQRLVLATMLNGSIEISTFDEYHSVLIYIVGEGPAIDRSLM